VEERLVGEVIDVEMSSQSEEGIFKALKFTSMEQVEVFVLWLSNHVARLIDELDFCFCLL